MSCRNTPHPKHHLTNSVVGFVAVEETLCRVECCCWLKVLWNGGGGKKWYS